MIEVSVCIGSACHLKGSYNVIQTLQQRIEEKGLHDKIELKAAFCMKQCQNPGVAVTIDGDSFSVAPEEAGKFFNTVLLPKLEA